MNTLLQEAIDLLATIEPTDSSSMARGIRAHARVLSMLAHAKTVTLPETVDLIMEAESHLNGLRPDDVSAEARGVRAHARVLAMIATAHASENLSRVAHHECAG